MTQGEELRRLLRYLAPYTGLLAAGILLLAGMGVAQGLVAFAIKFCRQRERRPRSPSTIGSPGSIFGSKRIPASFSDPPMLLRAVATISETASGST